MNDALLIIVSILFRAVFRHGCPDVPVLAIYHWLRPRMVNDTPLLLVLLSLITCVMVLEVLGTWILLTWEGLLEDWEEDDNAWAPPWDEEARGRQEERQRRLDGEWVWVMLEQPPWWFYAFAMGAELGRGFEALWHLW